jgi:hypothetical protein
MVNARILLAAAVISTSAVAGAQEIATVAVVQPTPAGFATIDRLDEVSRVGTSAGFSFFDDDATDALNFALHTDLWGQYVHPTGAAAYLALPISYLSADSDSESSLGNLEVGGGFVQGLTDEGQLAFRAGLVLPTSDDEDFFINILGTATPRLTDLVTSFPSSTWLRLAVSPSFRRGQLFLRADLGLDVPVDSDEGTDPDSLIRANLGGGVLAGDVALTAELATLGSTGDADDTSDRFVHTAALGARYVPGSIHPGLAVVTPLDDAGRGEVWAVLADVSVSLE